MLILTGDTISLLIFSIIVFLFPQFKRIYLAKAWAKKTIEVKQRIVFFDFIRGIAMAAVIFIHVAYFYDIYSFDFDNKLFVYTMNNLTRFAIALFIICSGVLLTPFLNKEKIVDFYRRKLARIFIPYTLFVIVLALYFNYSAGEFVYNLFSGQAMVPYYFIIVLLQLYLLYPLLIQFKDEKKVLIVCFIISLLSNFIPALYYFYGIPLFFRFLFFFAYGIYLRDKFLNYQADKKELLFWLFIVIIYIVLFFVFQDFYYNIRLFYGLAVFNILFYFKDWLSHRKVFYKFFVALGQKSLWVYLIHFSIVSAVYFIMINLEINYYLNFFIIFIISLIISYLAGTFLKLIYNYFIKKILKIKTSKFYA